MRAGLGSAYGYNPVARFALTGFFIAPAYSVLDKM